MKTGGILPGIALLTALAAPLCTFAEEGAWHSIDRGRYLVTIAGCNDCHTPGYGASAGTLPEEQWLTGDSVGFRGPWGTSYPVNLRLLVQDMTEREWVNMAKTHQMMPPMPWFNLAAMEKRDLRAVYRYIHSLGPAGVPAPEYLPPTLEPETPYINFTPVFPE